MREKPFRESVTDLEKKCWKKGQKKVRERKERKKYWIVVWRTSKDRISKSPFFHIPFFLPFSEIQFEHAFLTSDCVKCLFFPLIYAHTKTTTKKKCQTIKEPKKERKKYEKTTRECETRRKERKKRTKNVIELELLGDA